MQTPQFYYRIRLPARLFMLVGVVFSGCHAPGPSAITRESLSRGIERSFSERNELRFSVHVQHHPAVITAHAVHRRDGSGQLKVFDQGRPIYELITRCNNGEESMVLTERNYTSGTSHEYSVPMNRYFAAEYDPQWLGSINIGAFNGCLVGSYWRSWLAPQNDFREFLLEQVATGTINPEGTSTRGLVLVQTEPGPGVTHEFYFDAKEFLLCRWQTLFPGDPLSNRDRTFVYDINDASCLNAQDTP